MTYSYGRLPEWAISQPGTAERSEATASGVGPKAWRFAGEMEEIAAAFGAAGLPDGFALGAEALYRRLDAFRGRADVHLDELLRELLS